jgi:hypothetical protein
MKVEIGSEYPGACGDHAAADPRYFRDQRTAIRQFAQLFPAFAYLPANLLYIQDDPRSPIPDESAIRALGARLYHKFRFVSIQRRSMGFFEAWLGSW